MEMKECKTVQWKGERSYTASRRMAGIPGISTLQDDLVPESEVGRCTQQEIISHPQRQEGTKMSTKAALNWKRNLGICIMASWACYVEEALAIRMALIKRQ
ncbi:hypothetical protein ACH5RR_013829 [Cinchona calisaya]|uniref:Uncharacterized protein n=1 Tax=Cinchona calisaya TaxID=153742 RepID=A0ABD3A3S9_9GENT